MAGEVEAVLLDIDASDVCSGCFGEDRGGEADRAETDDDGRFTGLEGGAFDAVGADDERFDQRDFIRRDCSGEVEFINGVAAASASGFYGPVRACAGIVGKVDLTQGASAREVQIALFEMEADARIQRTPRATSSVWPRSGGPAKG